jgi:hypothetical protein
VVGCVVTSTTPLREGGVPWMLGFAVLRAAEQVVAARPRTGVDARAGRR